jgi:hypothetical protein
MKINEDHPSLLQTGDENIFNLIYNQYPELKSAITELDTTYNVGVTQFDLRYQRATKPVKVGAFKPASKGYEIFKAAGLVPEALDLIFKKHELI